MMWLALVFLAAVSSSSSSTTAADESDSLSSSSSLQFVVLIYRHGDRTPINPYPTDPYKDVSNW